MQRWSEKASRRLRDGERIETTVPVGENGIVVTSQRVLAFTPDSDGPNYQDIERPNVERVGRNTVGESGWVGYALRGLIAGLAGIGVGLTVEFDSLIDLGKINTQAAGQTGMGGMLGILQQVSGLVAMLDEVLLVGGLLALAAMLGAFGMYIESRTKTIQIAVAGEPDLHVPAASGDGNTVARLRRHLFSDGGAAPETGVTTDSVDSTDRGTLGTIRDSLTADDGTADPTREASPDEVDEAVGRAAETDEAAAVDDGPGTGDGADAKAGDDDVGAAVREASESAQEASAEEVADEILDFDDEE